MNQSNQTFHKFFASGLDPEKCAVCKVFKPNHICEICGLDNLELTIAEGKILMCPDCWTNENKLSQVNQDIQSELNNDTTELTDKELMMFRWTCSKCTTVNNGMSSKCMGRDCDGIRPDKLTEISTIAGAALQASRAIDNSITVKTDVFNAQTVAINDLKKIIDENVEITNKPFALASELKKRFDHFQSVIFDAQETIVDASNNQKAIQVYLNNLANSLRTEEREKLKIQDINYKPNPVKDVKVKTVKVPKPKLDKALLSKTAKELGIPEFTLQSFVIAKNCSIEVAANLIRQSLGK